MKVEENINNDISDSSKKSKVLASSGRILNAGFGDTEIVELSEDEDLSDDDGWVTAENVKRLNNVVN